MAPFSTCELSKEDIDQDRDLRYRDDRRASTPINDSLRFGTVYTDLLSFVTRWVFIEYLLKI